LLEAYTVLAACSVQWSVFVFYQTIKGSTVLFTALLKKCIEKGVVAICRYTARNNTPPRFVALFPQVWMVINFLPILLVEYHPLIKRVCSACCCCSLSICTAAHCRHLIHITDTRMLHSEHKLVSFDILVCLRILFWNDFIYCSYACKLHVYCKLSVHLGCIFTYAVLFRIC